MKIGIMQPYFLPYIGYWQLLNAVDKYVIYDDVNFIKGGWINRNRMLMNGEAKLFNIQMEGASPNKKINEVHISKNNVWKKKLIKSVETSYSKAKMYKNVFPMIERIINYETDNVAEYITNSLKKISEYLNIKTEFIISSEITKNCELKGQDKVIEICKVLGSDEYYNAIGGKELYSFYDFARNGIKLNFLSTKKIKYTQFSEKFIENLSILDILMFNSIEEINVILNEYDLIGE